MFIPQKLSVLSIDFLVRSTLLLSLLYTAILPAFATTNLEQLSLEQLMNISIVGAAKYEKKQQQVAAAVSVIARKDIRTYGWRTLNEVLASLPGIHSTYDYLGTRGFGLPGDFNTRVLITINGNRINDATYDQGPTGRYFPLDIDLIERIEFGNTGISGVARGMDGENVKQLFARASHGPLPFDFIYGNRRKDDPTGMFFSDPLVKTPAQPPLPVQ